MMTERWGMLIGLKVAMLRKGIRQTRMAVELGWDPAKLSRIVNEIVEPTPRDKEAIAKYLGEKESALFERLVVSEATREKEPA